MRERVAGLCELVLLTMGWRLTPDVGPCHIHGWEVSRMNTPAEPPTAGDLRLLPWTTPDGKPCYLSTDSDRSMLSRLADEIEAASWLSGEDVLTGAREVLWRPGCRRTSGALRAAEALGECSAATALRVAASRGGRVPDSARCDTEPSPDRPPGPRRTCRQDQRNRQATTDPSGPPDRHPRPLDLHPDPVLTHPHVPQPQLTLLRLGQLESQGQLVGEDRPGQPGEGVHQRGIEAEALQQLGLPGRGRRG
ncbi:hypothetical protein SALBM311S_10648 [Streptomyces alboniger]